MPIKRKVLVVSAGLILLIGVGVTALLLLFTSRTQQITLPNGTKLTLVGVTYGKRHTPPLGQKIPRRIRYQTPDDTLCVWLREEFTNANPGPYSVLAFDQRDDFSMGGGIFRRVRAGKGANVITLRFDSFPRADGKMRLRVSSPGSTNSPGEFAISFPAQKIISDWRPSPLPITQASDELSVTLTRLVYGVPPYPRNLQRATNAIGKSAMATFRVRENGADARNWRILGIDSSDPTGNHSLSPPLPNRRRLNEVTIAFPCTLSPDLPAWKLRVELIRESGYSEDELWTPAAIPVSTNALPRDLESDSTNVFTRVDFGDSTITVFPASLTTRPAELQLRVLVTPPPSSETQLTLVSVVDDRGRKMIPTRQNSVAGSFTYAFSQTDIKALNVTLALHHSRFVEFIAKPEKQ